MRERERLYFSENGKIKSLQKLPSEYHHHMASPHHPSIHPACSWFLRGFCIILLPSNPISQPSDRTGAFQGHQVCRAALPLPSARQPRLAEGTGLPCWAQDELHSLSAQRPPKQTPQIPFPEKSPRFTLLAPFLP